MFGNLVSGQPAVLIGEQPNAEALELSTRMRAAWTKFATHRDPGWPAFGPDERLTQIFDAHCAVNAYPELLSHQIWKEHPFTPHTLNT